MGNARLLPMVVAIVVGGFGWLVGWLLVASLSLVVGSSGRVST